MMLQEITRRGRDHQTILSCLKEYGICVIPDYYSRDFVERIRSKCVERMDGSAGDQNFSDGSYKRVDAYKGTGAQANERIYHVDCFSKDAEAFRNDPFLKDIGSAYYDAPHSVHVCIYERHRWNEVPVRGFHIDTFETSTYKAFLYLNDVESKDGPTSYIPGTHRDAELRHKKQHVWGPAVSPGDPANKPHPTNFTDEELGETLLKKHTPIIGRAGTVVLFDTWGVHKGISPHRDGERHVAVNYYRKGANLPRSDFGFDADADYKRYAVDYVRHMPAGGKGPIEAKEEKK